MRTPRRQNVCCDTCRRSKRRCKPKEGKEPDPSNACARCLRVGQPCTWDFVHAQATAKKVALHLRRGSENRLASGSQSDPHVVDRVTEGDADKHVKLRSKSTDSRARPEAEPAGLRRESRQKLQEAVGAAIQPPKTWKEEADWPRSLGPWTSSSTVSLNRTFSSSIFSQKHTAIYQIVQKWCSERYLSQFSNPFSPRSGYVIEPESHGPDIEPSVASRHLASSSEGCRALTLLSAAGILDSFAELYGNPLTHEDQHHATRAQQAVFRAWSMQWFPSSGTNKQSMFEPDGTTRGPDNLLQSERSKDIYSAYWWQAHCLLLNTRASSSFKRILAVLMFSTVAAPDQVLSNLAIGDRPLDLLYHAIVQMQALLRMLHQFCYRLAPSSEYRTLLECAGSIMHWFGYLRDTSAAASHGWPPMMYDVHIPHKFQTDVSELDTQADRGADITQSAESARHQMAMSIIALWRRAIRLENTLSRENFDLATSMAILRSCCNLIELSDAHEVWVIETELDGRANPESTIRTSSAHLLLSWNYGVLKIVQQCRRMQFLPCFSEDGTLLQQMIHKLDAALIRSMSLVAVTLSSDGQNDTGAVEVAWVAQNSNLPLVTQILTAFLDHAVGLYSTSSLAKSPTRAAIDAEVDQRYMANLLRSLSLLQRTMHGSSVVREALQGLMGRHSDVLMGAWLSNEYRQAV